MKTRKLTKAVAMLGIVAALALGGVTSAQAAGSAPVATQSADVPTVATVATSSANCSGGRCWILFNKAETAALGQGRIPAPPASVPAQIKLIYYATALIHRAIAADYARKGYCSAFILSIYPWEGRGYTWYRC